MTAKHPRTASKAASKPASRSANDDRVAALRRFNRFYTRQVGALEEHLLASQFSLVEARVLYEIANRQSPTAAEIAAELTLDAGYMSRTLRRLLKLGLVTRTTSKDDRRRSLLALTAKGEKAFAELDAAARQEIAALLRPLTPAQEDRLFDAIQAVEEVLGGDSAKRPRSYLLRAPGPGDLGWVVSRHGALYAEEYGWDERFEALVAEIVAGFVHHDSEGRQRCWIVEMDGAPVGSVFVTRKSATVAQLRLLLVEPRARGLGIGARLVDECVAFARQSGYRRLRLWTQSTLDSARRIYERAGFRLVERERHRSFGPELVAETWELEL
jgi:DNA-binding MarR family transcriptional regulator/N-acetylglutamate synthase-like GNAT family acetyltransferase